MASKAKALDAIRRLKEAKQAGGGVARLVDFKDDRVFDEVTEDEYAKLVADRRKASDFVEDDEGLGYADDGEEGHSDGDAAGSGDDAEGDDAEGAAAAAGRAAAKTKKASALLAMSTGSTLFKSTMGRLATGAAAVSSLRDEDKRRAASAADSGYGGGVDIDDLLADIDHEAGAGGRGRRAGGPPPAARRTSYGAGAGASSSSSSYQQHGGSGGYYAAAAGGGGGSSYRTSYANIDALLAASSSEGGGGGGGGEAAYEDDYGYDGGALEAPPPARDADEDAADPAAGAGAGDDGLDEDGAAGGGRRPAIKRAGLSGALARQQQHAAASAARATPAAAPPAPSGAAPGAGSWLSADSALGGGGDLGASGLGGVTGAVIGSDELDKARPGLPPIASLMERVPLPAAPARASAAAAPAAAATAASPFGLGESDQLLFYWLDAHEDPWARPGVLHLFGKVCTNMPAVLEARRHNEELARGRSSAPPTAAEPSATAATVAATAASPLEGGGSPAAAPAATDVVPAAKQAPMPEPEPLFASACLTVAGLERCVYVLPRECTADGDPVAVGDVYTEVRELLTRHLGSGNVRFRAKPVKRSYAFELDGVPRSEAGYLKVAFDGKSRPLQPSALSGRTYAHMFGTTSSLLEQFLLKRDMMGPAWLRVRGARVSPSPASWCAYDLLADSPKSVTVYSHGLSGTLGSGLRAKPHWAAYLRALPAMGLGELRLEPPPLVVLSLSTRTVLDPKKHAHEVVAVALTTHKAVEADGPSREHASLLSTKVIIRPLSSTTPLPGDLKAHIAKLPPAARGSLVAEASERALLNHVLNAIGKVDPDVLVGHNITGFDLDVLLHRCDAVKAQLWSRLGRLRRSTLPRASVGSGGRLQFSGNLTVGRLVCDTYLAARENLRETTYTLTALAERHLGARRVEIDPADVPRHLTGSGEMALGLMQAAAQDARLALGLMFKLQVLPLTKQLTNLAGNLWSRSLRGARAERIEYLLLHEFHNRKFITPDKVAYGAGGGGGGGGKGGKGESGPAADDDEVVDAPGGDDEDDEAGGVGGVGGGGGGGGRRAGVASGSGTIARNAKKRGKPAYSGGLVLEPKKGLYDKCVVVLDFNSLYPSIIQEYNICFTTVERPLTPLDDAHAAAVGGSGGHSSGVGGKRKSSGGSKAGTAKKAKRGSTADAGGAEGASAGGDEAGEQEGAEGGADAGGGDEAVGGTAVGGSGGDGAAAIPALPDLARFPELGVLPKTIQMLVHKRRAVKALMARERNPAQREALEIRQKALKILANSMYGCLGFGHSRFYARPIAALVTSQGRDILQRTMDLATDSLGADVIYGDTDSLFLYTGSAELAKAKEMGAKLKREVNKLYRYLEIEVDAIFKSMLLLKKKKYAAVELHEGPGGVVTESREAKGLDLVRRDWCVLSRELGDRMLGVLLSGKEKDAIVEEAHDMMRAVAAELRDGRVALDKFVITKGLNKAPQDYPDVKGQAHLQVALAMLKAGKTVNVGDHVPYVICLETVGTVATGAAAAAGGAEGAGAGAGAGAGSSPSGTGASPLASGGADGASPTPGSGRPAGGQQGSFVTRAYHPDDVRKAGGALHIDLEWYLSTQILPPIARLCEPIDGTSQARLAECLGLDITRFARIGGGGAASTRDDDRFALKYSLPFEQRFKDCEPFYTVCSACSQTEHFAGPFLLTASKAPDAPGVVRCGLDCSAVGCDGIMIPFGVGDISKLPSALSVASLVPQGVDPIGLCAARFSNLAIAQLRSKLLAFESGVAICDDAVCGHSSRALSTQLDGQRCVRAGCRGGKCSLLHESASLHLWVEYVTALFDVQASKADKEKQDPKARIPGLPPTHVEVFKRVSKSVAGFLDRCAYNFVPKSVFRYLNSVKR